MSNPTLSNPKNVQPKTQEDVQPDARTLHLAEALIDPVKRSKLIRIHNALNKKVAGLTGTIDLRDSVRYGISGFTFREIGELLT